jgi:hypothetical protein
MRSKASLFKYLPGSSEIFYKFKRSVSHDAHTIRHDRPLRSPNRELRLRFALPSIHGLSIPRLFNRMSWPAIARRRGVTLFGSNAIEIPHRKIDASE